MSIFDRQTELLTKIYPEHVWLDITDVEISLTKAELNQRWIEKISTYLTDLGLVVKLIFPNEELYLPLISELVDGFALSVSGIKVAFIPSEDLDLAGFEVQQEWVDLSNWVADYYVPIQIDREYNYLHLWGFISHQSIQQKANLDRTLRSYEVESTDPIEDLQILWLSCELVNDCELASRGTIPHMTPLSASEAQVSIERLQQHKSMFSPRLVLPFEQWGAIMNAPEYLNLYANPVPAITKIANWFRSQIAEIEYVGNTLADRGWVTITEIANPPKLLSGYCAAPSPKTFTVRTIPLGNEREIDRAVKSLYDSQDAANKVDLPSDRDSPQALLIYLMQYTTDEYLRWQAAEYLWTIAPDNHLNWHRRIKDLGLLMQGHQLGLMVAAIPLLDGTYAVLNRLYPIGNEDNLPSHVRLSLLSEEGSQLCEATSKSTVKDSYIQLYFTASIGDRFNVRVSTSENSITEAFAI